MATIGEGPVEKAIDLALSQREYSVVRDQRVLLSRPPVFVHRPPGGLLKRLFAS